ncbi:hypothetical protein SFBSU_006G699 [Candidatus Arthromitus sp. SFB-mouse-SU]|uniref:hypothetical protein n=1 Tax=unclassified Candidatus Neoarthromitus TaxID=2638829 RepID=UPI00022968DC|nr:MULTISPECIES: hypothetical protein [unclassified Candidatus Arthromitus]EIA24528.1 hypothetical protein SFB1_055G37 [Candidatus Arthromitus sp. SFB-1]EIA28770.1 hypothetical protein SFB6_030G40 [Candidatus Arthromitus sp. SFB-co]EIA31018.1 hypothetical protein SFBSU_006G699 [Candidatus Arthromitus sp. SFB-mouse-SU]AID44961.1 Hypothetical protein SFBmNL_01056 [Candidatus Arthromitus sp. SFB-mouse-NL]EGX28571.1 hypothetical protein SFBNYU_005920 [Candidatus Arthromitus sp. SFB-mouse-NYU]
MLLESIISLSIFVVIAVSMNNYIISSVKYLISNINISTNVLKIRELEVFLNSELNEYAFDFKVNSDKKISYKKIIPISTSQCEVKKRDITFGNGTITLKYDDRNVTNLLKNVDDFRIYKNGNLVFIKILLGDIELIKPISLMSYNI